MNESKDWLTKKRKEKGAVYEQYGKPLEKQHNGEYLAVSLEGETILGEQAGEVLHKAVASFGSRNFSLIRVGYSTFGKWLILRRP